ncbi:MAG: NADAR family protein [Gammaproteobacteria bacterium]
MFFTRKTAEPVYLSRTDAEHPLSSFSPRGFHLDEADWPTVEHYYQAMKFEPPEQREAIRACATPEQARDLAKQHARSVRDDWKQVRQTMMIRAVYIRCRTHADIAEALLATGDRPLMENSQYDYYWGCGRDGRGNNAYGKVLENVRAKLKAERSES